MKTKNLFALALFPLLMSGCSPYSVQSEDPVTIKDMLDREVSFDRNKIKRVVCLGAGALRFYSYVGEMNKLVGVEEIDSENTFGVGQAIRPYYQANKTFLSTLPLIGKGGPAAQFPEKEKIIAVNPDIIISFYSDVEVNNELQSTLKVPVVALKQGGDGIFDEVTLKSLDLLGNIFKRTDRSNAIRNYVSTSLTELNALTETTETYYAGCIGNWGKTNLYGSFNKFPVFKYAKAKNALDALPDLNKGQVTIDSEKLLDLDPDKIFLDTSGLNQFIESYKQDPTVYDALKAFENKETYLLLPYNAYYTNLEIQLMSTYYVASVAHPESFPNFNLDNKMDEILTTFVGKSIYSELKEHQYGFGGYQKVDIEDLIK